jgi:hypothetical protein
MTAIKHWPFVESPGEFTDRLATALEIGTASSGAARLLAAVRTVLIEEPPEISPDMLRLINAANSAK